MRRKEKEITNREEILEIINNSLVCRLAMCDGDKPYIVPMSFGLDGDKLYFHSAKEGTKIEILKRNPNVCFEFDIDAETIPGESPCTATTRYRSVTGFGRVCFIEDENETKHGLDIITKHYLGTTSPYLEQSLTRTQLFRVDIQSLTGKKSS